MVGTGGVLRVGTGVFLRVGAGGLIELTDSRWRMVVTAYAKWMSLESDMVATAYAKRVKLESDMVALLCEPDGIRCAPP